MANRYKWTLPCQALLDQGVYIGDDPVGHACLQPSQWLINIDGSSVYVCNSCKTLVDESSPRISFTLATERSQIYKALGIKDPEEDLDLTE